MNNALRTQLQGIRSAVTFHTKSEPVIGNDGVNHINMAYNSETELGRFLSTRYRMPFTHPDYGDFNSIEGLWVYLSNLMDKETEVSVRLLYGGRLKNIGSKLERKKTAGFKTIISETIYQKIMANEEMRDALINNRLPLQLYYVGKENKRTVPAFSKWYIRAIYIIRKAIIDDKAPIFDYSDERDFVLAREIQQELPLEQLVTQVSEETAAG